jgi:hypothetical protein
VRAVTVMPNIPSQRSLGWTLEELAFQTLVRDCLDEFDVALGTDWTFDESRQVYYCTFEVRGRTRKVMVSRAELRAEFGRSSLSDGIRNKLDDAGLRDRRIAAVS